MRPKSVRDRVRDMWTIMRGRSPEYRSPYADPADEDDPGAEEDEARVPVGPRRPSPRAGAIALPLPEPEENDVDAYGRAADGT